MPPDTLGARGTFLLLFAAEIARRSRDRDEREKTSSFPLATIAAVSIHPDPRLWPYMWINIFFSKDFTQNILKINEAIVVLRSLRYI